MVTTRTSPKVKATPQEKPRHSKGTSGPSGGSPPTGQRRSSILAGGDVSNNNTLNNDQEIVNDGTSRHLFANPPNGNEYETPRPAKASDGNIGAAMLNDPTECTSPANGPNENDNNSKLSSETEKNTIVGQSINQEKEDSSVVPMNTTTTNNTEKIATTPTEEVPTKSCNPSPTNNDKHLRDTKSYDAKIHNTMWAYLYPMQKDKGGNIVCEYLRTNYNTYNELACKNIMLSFLGHSLPRKRVEEGRTSPGHDMEILLVPPEEESRRVSLYEEYPSFRSIVLSCTYVLYSNSSMVILLFYFTHVICVF